MFHKSACNFSQSRSNFPYEFESMIVLSAIVPTYEGTGCKNIIASCIRFSVVYIDTQHYVTHIFDHMQYLWTHVAIRRSPPEVLRGQSHPCGGESSLLRPVL